MRALLALADGTYFEGESFGAPGEAMVNAPRTLTGIE